MAAHMCPYGTTVESRTHVVVGECEIYKEKRDALEEGMRIFGRTWHGRVW